MTEAIFTVHVNDEPIELDGDNHTLQAVMDVIELESTAGVAVAVNGLVVPKDGWAGHHLQESDNILLIQATQGG